MRMIEKAARAMEARLYAMDQSENGPDCYRRIGMDEYKQLAEAVLEAVRVPSDDCCIVGRSKMPEHDEPLLDDAKETFTAMIDHILNESAND